MTREIVDELFTKINLIVLKVLSIQKILCINKNESSELLKYEFQNEYENQVKIYESNHFTTLREFYRKNVKNQQVNI